ncbi:MAG: hypothetical protein ACYTEQ_03515 [Planctomycetota bacterium]
MKATEIWGIAAHEKGGVNVKQLGEIIEVNVARHKEGKPLYGLLGVAATMEGARELKREILAEERRAQDEAQDGDSTIETHSADPRSEYDRGGGHENVGRGVDDRIVDGVDGGD